MSLLDRRISAILLAGLFIIISCAKDSTEVERTPTSTFPLTTDSRWEYRAIWHTIPFNEPSLADTVTIGIYRHIIGSDSLPGIANLTVCDDTVITNQSGQIDTSINRQWLKMEDDKLKMFAYDEILIGNDPDPDIYDFPRNLLDFPLGGGKGWIVYSEISTQESKTVAGIDYIELPFGWQYCDVVRGTVLHSTSGDTLRSTYEWYTDDGLMRIEYDHGVIVITDELGAFLDSVRAYETWDLIGMDIRP